MARFTLWARVPGTQAPVKVWDGAAAADAFQGRDFDAAVGWCLRNAADCVMRDGNATDPLTRIRVLFVRHGPGEAGDGS